MPTPQGKPKAGETIYGPDGQVVGKVLERLSGNVCYSVRVQTPDGRKILITEFDYWVVQRKWTIR